MVVDGVGFGGFEGEWARGYRDGRVCCCWAREEGGEGVWGEAWGEVGGVDPFVGMSVSDGFLVEGKGRGGKLPLSAYE